MTSTRVDPLASESDAALHRYRTRLRKQRLVYFSVVGVLLLALASTVTVAWERGEVANTTLHTVATPPATLPVATPAAAPTVAWRTTDHAAIGDPRFGGTVVVYGRHAVRGVDARTGAQTWTYTRSNRTVCAAVQSAGTTVAVYRVGGNCDELTALASDTGQRKWTRTLDQDGQPVNGTPTFQVLASTMLVTTSSVVYAIDLNLAYNQWTYARFGCTINGAVVGGASTLISQTCTDPRCGQIKFCGRGPQLFLRSDAGTDDKSKNPTNFDHIMWNLMGNTDVPVSADVQVAGLNTTTRRLDLFNSSSGRPIGSTILSPEPTAAGPISATAAGDDLLVTVRGVAAALGGDPGRPSWARGVTAPLTAVAVPDSAELDLDNARITVPTSTGAAVLDGVSGRVIGAVTLSPRPAAGSSIYPLGAGQLAVGSAGTVAYQ